MSLLRVCAFAKCLNRRSLFEQCAVRLSRADRFVLCVSLRDGAVRRISETPWQLQRKNISFVPKREDAKKLELKQSLLHVLEARIQQLQSDTVLDVQHAKTQPLIKTIKGHKKVSVETSAGVSSTVTSTVAGAAAGTAAKTQKESKGKRKESKNPTPKQTVADAKLSSEELVEVKELERLSQQLSQFTSLSNPQVLQRDSERAECGDLYKSIFSYLEACVFAEDFQRAQRLLIIQHKRKKKVMNTNVYNIMIRMLAKHNNLNQIGRIFIMLEEANLKPNLGSYCSVLECMGRKPNCPPTVVTRCLTRMEEEGLSLDDVFRKGVFRQDERDMVLKAVQIVQPDYQPSLKTDTEQCSSSLVHDYYTQQSDHRYPKLDFSQEELQQRFKKQLTIEQDCTITIDSVEAKKPITENMAKMRKLLADQRVLWQKSLLQALRESKKILANTNTVDYKPNLYPYLCVLEDKEYVDIMIQSIDELPPSGEALKILAKYLGGRVNTKYSVRQKQHNQTVEKLNNIYDTYTDLVAKDGKGCDTLPREQWCKIVTDQSSGPSLQGGESDLPFIVTLELGMYMLDLMVNNVKINSDILNPDFNKKLIPLIYHMYTFRSTRQVGFIKPHPILSQMQLEAMETKLTFDSYVMPMLCPPVPWNSVKSGAYLLTPSQLMRTAEGATQHEVLLEQCQNLHAVLDALNQLGNCAWRINKLLLDIIISIFNDRGNDKLGIPPPLSEAPKIPYFSPQDPSNTSSEKAHMKREASNARKKGTEMHSLRMDTLYKLSIANCLRDEIFWFPHNMDFRGRTYPCPPHFNHLGSDVTRAVLVFADGKPLGPKGLDWIKIHLVNLTGLKKKSSLEGRLEYANTIMEDILDSADNPLTGKKWWMNAEEPWQALGCCMEIANAVRSPDPTRFISHFPVHQDGSCNGLQHYAALGRDVIGATSVNLTPCELPQDVYSGVAQQVEEFRVRDAKNGVKIAKVLEGVISRKVVKQTVMTVVYGVTRFGGRLQIEKRLKEIDGFPKEHIWDASRYLVRLVFNGLKEMFTGTREIQEWLTESAKLISKAGHSVQWVTPLGLPVIQPYHCTRRIVRSVLLCGSPEDLNGTGSGMPDTVKQKNAFPPNFIHSLDSTHMMLTSLHCYSAGLAFVSVHDCFWTHALTVDTMNKICREQFVALHSQPILQELSNYLVRKYCTGIPVEAKKKKTQEYLELRMCLATVPQTGQCVCVCVFVCVCSCLAALLFQGTKIQGDDLFS
ncbi:DNA-directed RNA polymerase mitochondrial [Dissostichus eleginoides]|uniref:DNA-directed RNA polymerase n=1 Tax=Dissostichus eleginoides TaxID=100907 RepID=A0AAD9FFC2_DISEL|nr:DNA-directed RNA polymerase mitochondrial [Dissostichus eleginoides]